MTRVYQLGNWKAGKTYILGRWVKAEVYQLGNWKAAYTDPAQRITLHQ